MHVASSVLPYATFAQIWLSHLIVVCRQAFTHTLVDSGGRGGFMYVRKTIFLEEDVDVNIMSYESATALPSTVVFSSDGSLVKSSLPSY